MKPSELLDKPHKWIKGELAVDDKGKTVGFNNPKAEAFCIYGALMRCSAQDEAPRLREHINKNSFILLSDWNNAPERTYEEVISLLKEHGL